MKTIPIPKIPYTNTSGGVVKAQEDMTTPKLEALVRESLQNSLDATNESDRVIVNFGYSDYAPERLSDYFPEISHILKTNSKKFMYVQDMGTVGLDGDIYDDESNYRGLVKNINQSGKKIGDLGGSWGKGKSVFYRQGIGFVIFYSRIVSGGIYESRLNAVFVNWKDLDYHPIDNWTGISLWGEESTNQFDVDPVRDESEIKKILDCFGLQPYCGKDTGTTIIMPAVDEKDLLSDVEEGTSHDKEKTWLVNVEGCIDFYVQKWFSPRLNNMIGGKSTLLSTINGKQILIKYKLFQCFQNLYNDTFDLSKGNVINLPLKNQNRSYGHLAWKIYSESELKDNVFFNNPNKLCNIHNVSEKGNRPIITYVRSPGMFLTFDEPELTKLPETDSESYLLAVFRLNSDKNTTVVLKNKEEMSLESYVRSTEKSNHGGWKDIAGTSDNYVGNIMSQIRNKLYEKMKSGDVTKVIGRRSTDGRFVAEALFPKDGSYIRNFREHPDNPPRSPRNPSKRSVSLTDISEKQTLDGVIERCTIVLKNVTALVVKLGASAESETLYKNEWEEKIGSKFPLSFIDASVKQIEKSDGVDDCDICVSVDHPKVNSNRMVMRMDDYSKIIITLPNTYTSLKIEFSIRRPNTVMVSPVLTVTSGAE